MQNVNGVTNRAGRRLVSLYFDSITDDDFEALRCNYCGHPILETANPLRAVVSNSGSDVRLVMGVIVQCKRCKQKYRAVLHEY